MVDKPQLTEPLTIKFSDNATYTGEQPNRVHKYQHNLKQLKNYCYGSSMPEWYGYLTKSFQFLISPKTHTRI